MHYRHSEVSLSAALLLGVAACPATGDESDAGGSTTGQPTVASETGGSSSGSSVGGGPGTTDGTSDQPGTGPESSGGEGGDCDELELQSTHDVVTSYVAAWNEDDAQVRDCLLQAVWASDGAYSDPLAEGEGVSGLGEVIAAFREGFPGSQLSLRSGVVQHHDTFLFQWQADTDPPIVGMDFGRVAQDGRIRQIVGFFGDPPPGNDAPASIQAYFSVWNEPNDEARRAALSTAVAERGRYSDPTTDLQGRDALFDYVTEYRADFPGTSIEPITSALDSNDWWTIEWAVSGADGQLYTGRDVFELDDAGMITGVTGFFGPLPPVGEGGFVRDDCLTCIELSLQSPPDPAQACAAGASTSAARWDALQACTCNDACGETCGENLCAGGPPSQECDACVGLPVNLLMVCPDVFVACMADG